MDNSKKSFLGELIKGIIVAIITCLLTGFITNQFTKNDIVKAITTRFDFVDSKMTYEEALEQISQELKNSQKEIESLNKELDEKKNLIDEQNSSDEINKIIQNATQYWDDSDYKSCLILLKNSKVRSTDIETLYFQYSDKYVLILLSQADSLISQRKYEDAVKILEDGKILVNDEKMIVSKIDDINNSRAIKLSDIKLTSSRFFTDNEGKSLIDTVGNKYSTGNSFITYAEGKTKCGYGTFYLGKKYTSLSGIIAVSDESEDRDDIQLQGWIEIGTKSNDKDFNSLWSSQILSRTTSSIEIPELNLEGSEWLEIRYYNNGEYYSLANGYHSLKIILTDVMLYVD